MKNKFTYLLALFIGLIFIGQSVYSEIVPIEKARLVAKNVYFERVNLSKEVNFNNIFFGDEYTVSENNKAVYYVFNISNQAGFVIVSAESEAFPVLGYAFEGYFSPNNLNEALEAEMENFKDQIIETRSENYKSKNEYVSIWEKYLKSSFTKSTESIAQAGPLVLTKWDQGCNYNTLCPTGTYACGHMPTGCVATAMAQMMKFWSYPSKGTGSNSYNSVVPHNVDFSAQTYNWAAMPLTATTTSTEIAKLMYHAGVSVNMSYGNGGSSASTQIAGDKLRDNFKYSSAIQYISKGNNVIDWHIKIRANIISGKPVMYRGTGSYGGHSFIIDGFQYPEFYHVNFGWGGSGDGYYYLNAINSTNNNGDFNNGQGALINIYPSTMSGAKLTDENENNESASIYPNPNNGNFSLLINNDFSGKVEVKILDMTSRVIENITLNKESSLISHDFNLNNLSNGFYYISIENNNQRLVKKFIIK